MAQTSVWTAEGFVSLGPAATAAGKRGEADLLLRDAAAVARGGGGGGDGKDGHGSGGGAARVDGTGAAADMELWIPGAPRSRERRGLTVPLACTLARK